MIIKADTSRKVGAYCQGERTEGTLSEEERNLHINVLELKALKAAKFAIVVFTQNRIHLNSIHIQMDNMVARSYLVRMRE